jgi:CHAT domain-containing protein
VGKFRQPAALELTLYSLLVAPIPRAFRLPRLIIVRDGPLNRLPFEALRDSGGHYLVQSQTVLYAPSSTTSYVLRAQRRPMTPFAFLGIGGIPYRSPSPTASSAGVGSLFSFLLRGLDSLAGVHFGNLPTTRQEVIEAGRVFGASRSVLLIGSKATKAAFEREPLGEFSIIHFAAHAVTTPRFPERSALVLVRAPYSDDDCLKARGSSLSTRWNSLTKPCERDATHKWKRRLGLFRASE